MVRVISVLFISLLGTSVLSGCKTVPLNSGTSEERQIARACIDMSRSSLREDSDIDADDSRIPEAIRLLHPHDIQVYKRTVVVSFPLRDGLTEYHMVKTKTGLWQLYGAGPKYDNQHRELLQIEDE
jgi:hypothetical protein